MNAGTLFRLPFRRPITLRYHLSILVLVTMVPLLIFSGFMIYYLAKRERANFQQGATERMRALITAVDAELKASLTKLEALATDETLRIGNMPDFYDLAERALKARPDWLTIDLTDKSGRQIINLLRPFGAKVAKIGVLPEAAQVMQTGRPVIGNLGFSQVAQQYTFAVRVPVFHNGTIRYVLSAVIKSHSIGALLASQNLPSDWSGVVLDSNRQIVASNVPSDGRIGELAPQDLRDVISRSPVGWYRRTMPGGRPVYTASAHSTFSGWSIAIFIPAALLERPLGGPVLYISVFGAGLMGLGLWLAWLFSGKTAASIESLVVLVRNLGLGKDTAAAKNAVPTHVAEVEHLEQSFLEAARLIRERSDERDRLEEALRLDVAQRVRTEQALAEAVRRRQALYQFLEKRQRAKTVEEMYEAALDCILSSLRCERAAIMRHDASKIMRFAAWRGLSETYRRAVEGHSPWMPDQVDPQPVCVGDVRSADLNAALKATLKAEGIAALSFIPLILNGKLAGKFMIYYHVPHVLSNQEVNLALTIARQLAVGIEHKQADEALKSFSADLEKTVADRTEGLMKLNAELVESFTEREKLQEQLRLSQKMEAVGSLASGVAHDFNNILSIILGYARELANRNQSPEVRRSADIISNAADRGAALVKQLLTFARVPSAEKRAVDINLLIHNSASLIDVILQKNATYNLVLDPTLTAVHADSNQLQQILINLSVNARDAMPDGGHLRICTSRASEEEVRTVFGEAAGDYARIEVNDTGAGMDDETRQRIFEPFFTTKQAQGGTGLGLSVVYGIVREHGGFIDVQSKKGRGTTFQIYLPLLTQAPASVAVPIKSPQRVKAQGETILIVDDEVNLVLLLKRTAERRGFRAVPAHNGKEAIELYAKHRDEIAVVLLDWAMPQLGGSAVFRKLKELNPDVKVIGLTGYIDPVSRDTMLKEGVCEFLQKPSTPREIFERVWSVCRAAEPASEQREKDMVEM